MRPSILPSAAGVVLVLAGCAAAMPGYTPDKGRLKLSKDKVAAKSNEAAKAEPSPPPAPPPTDGTYVLTSKERGFSCRRLTGVLQIKIQQVRADLSRQPASRILAKTGDTARDRAHLVALNELMVEKKCGRFDLDADLRPEKTDTPEPIKPEGKKEKKKR